MTFGGSAPVRQPVPQLPEHEILVAPEQLGTPESGVILDVATVFDRT